MAVAAAVHPWPSSPPPARPIAAWRVRAADAVICLFIANMWLIFLGLTAMEIGLLACGEDSLVVHVAAKVAAAAGFTLIPVFLCGVLPLRPSATAGAPTDIEAPKAPAPKSSAAALREALRDPIMLGVLASMVLIPLVVVGALLRGYPPVMGSRRERMGSVIYHVGALGMFTVDCFVVCPFLTVSIWRTWRMEA